MRLFWPVLFVIVTVSTLRQRDLILLGTVDGAKPGAKPMLLFDCVGPVPVLTSYNLY